MAHGDPDEKTFLYILYLVTWQRGGQIWIPPKSDGLGLLMFAH